MLQEFADLLMELKCAKIDGALSGLTAHDEPIYLKPIITKLPADIEGVIHRRPHPLKQCRAFQANPIEQRKGLLKQYGICYRWVASSNFMGKDCKSPTSVLNAIVTSIYQHFMQVYRHALAMRKPLHFVDPKPQNDTQGRGEEVGKVTTIRTKFVVSNLEESRS